MPRGVYPRIAYHKQRMQEGHKGIAPPKCFCLVCGDELVSLCNSCHSKTNVNRSYWKNYFQNQKNESLLVKDLDTNRVATIKD